MIRTILLLTLLTVTDLSAVNNSQSSTKDSSPRIYQPKDQTDIYAIPLDEDEEEQDEELNSLEHPNQ